MAEVFSVVALLGSGTTLGVFFAVARMLLWALAMGVCATLLSYARPSATGDNAAVGPSCPSADKEGACRRGSTTGTRIAAPTPSRPHRRLRGFRARRLVDPVAVARGVGRVLIPGEKVHAARDHLLERLRELARRIDLRGFRKRLHRRRIDDRAPAPAERRRVHLHRLAV